MSNILLCWELGDGEARLQRFAALADELARRGHTPIIAARDLAQVPRWIDLGKHAVLPAPLWLPRLENAPAPNDYSAMLAIAGWLDAHGLAGLIEAWRNLFRLARADLVIADFAPTALLATRNQNLPACAMGSGFDLPASSDGVFVAFAYWKDLLGDKTTQQHLLDLANVALHTTAGTPLTSLTDLFGNIPQIAWTVPEYDHYPRNALPSTLHYCGLYHHHTGQGFPSWPPSPGPRVFAQIHPLHRDLPELVRALSASGTPCILQLLGPVPDTIRKACGSNIVLATQELNASAALANADLAIHHALEALTAQAILAGIPQLLMPLQVEQMMLARRLHTNGLALLHHPVEAPQNIPECLQALLSTDMRARAQSVAARCNSTPQKTTSSAADLCCALLNQ